MLYNYRYIMLEEGRAGNEMGPRRMKSKNKGLEELSLDR